MENHEKKGLKHWLDILKANTRAFFKHPIQFTKDYIASFKTLDTKGKIKKALLTIAGIYVAYITIGLAVAALICISFFGSNPVGNYEEELYEQFFVEENNG